MRTFRMLLALCAFLWAHALLADVPAPFAIEVVDEATGRGVPLVELETVNQVLFVTDSNGLIAITCPDLMGQKVWFFVRSHGYEFPADGFGFRGKAIEIEPGGKAQLKLKRINIAERLYRTTGAGIYRDTILLGQEAPLAQPLINGQVWGCDSTMAAIYQGKIHWFWGDTSRPSYPLGNFAMTGATSQLPSKGGLDPNQGINFQYFVRPDGFAKGTAPVPGPGPTWISAVTVLQEPDGREGMYASYIKIRNSLEAYEWGMLRWNDEKQEFEVVRTFENKPVMALVMQDHPFHHKDGETEYVYFSTPFPLMRVKATPEAFLDPTQYEGYTCLQEGTLPQDRKLDRRADGTLNYSWKRNTPPLRQDDQQKLIKAGVMQAEEALIQLQDPETGRAVSMHRGSTYWNEHRQRWVMIGGEEHGETSYLGEIWYAEADSPVGPWVYARKIITHDKYSFYNPKHHPFFDQENGRVLYLEGTYTHSFSGNPKQTPRYDYNPIMYRIDLKDDRLNLPVAVYRSIPEDEQHPFRLKIPQREIAFFALDRPGTETIPIYVSEETESPLLSLKPMINPGGLKRAPVFHALSANLVNPPPTTALLYEFRHQKTREPFYSTAAQLSGYERMKTPLCRVWTNPRSPSLK